MDCLFCSIIKGDIPSKKVYDDELCYAFYDINPQAPVHFLVVPKLHIPSADAVSLENSKYVSHIFEVIPKIAKELGLELLAPDASVYLPNCISAFVGADTVCALLATDLCGADCALLADIGTNGEMVLAHEDKLLCCATAAGPAFEGAGLSCGMPAKRGAIRKVVLQDGEQTWETVQDAEPVGICGSGILDALVVALQTENMDDSGFLEEEIDLGGVMINQKDVRQIQLAKSAVCAGLITLLEEADVPAEGVEVFSIAGGFGSSMDLDSAKTIGLFPAALREKTDFIGNAALGGAAMLLLNREIRAKSETLADAAEEIELSASAAFMDYYVDCMSFMEF